MSETAVFPWLLAAWFALACLSFVVLLLMPAPYGRYVEQDARRTVPSRWGWVVMEAAAVLAFAATFATGRYRHTTVAIVFFALWMAHYLQRAFVYPFLQRAGKGRMPVAIVACALLFNLVNGYLNGRYLFEALGRLPGRLAEELALRARGRAVRGGLCDQPAGRLDPAQPPLAWWRRLRDSPRRPLSLGVVPQLPRRASCSGSAGQSPPGPSPASPSRSGRRPTWCRDPGPITAGTGCDSRTTRVSAERWSRGSG